MTNPTLQADAERLAKQWTEKCRIAVADCVEYPSFNKFIEDCLQSAFQAGAEEMRVWYPIDTAPKDGTPLLLRCGDTIPYIGLWMDGSKITHHDWYCFEHSPHRRLSGVTHWMHLPDALPEYGEKK